MITKAIDIRIQYNEQRKAELVLPTDLFVLDISELKAVIAKGKELSIKIEQYRQKRSLDANAYMWVLLSKMADALNTTKDELYLQVLERYGVFTHIVVNPAKVEQFKREWRACRELGEVTVNGKTGIQLQCFLGSSHYDTKQMSVLIDGIVSECKEMEIETLPPDELARMKNEWGK